MPLSNKLGDLARAPLVAALQRLARPSSPPTGAEPSGAPSSGAGDVRVQVVFVQYDRVKYRGALERLSGLLAVLDGVDASIVVVDNARPGRWAHQVTDRLSHVGGDNSGWEFSAFDRGLQHLEATDGRADVYALVTDAYAAYGTEYLGLLDAEVIRSAACARSVIGWVDSWPEETTLFGHPDRAWLRTSMMLVPAELLSIVRPLSTGLERSRLFSGKPEAPFLPDAPLGPGLRRYLLEWLTFTDGDPALGETWHSRFALDASNLRFFEDKVCAILREHLLAVRLREAGVLAHDLRLFRRLAEGGTRFEALDPPTLARLAWDGWNAPDEANVLRPPRWHLDRVAFPRDVAHGEPLRLQLEGWVLAVPQPESVRLRLGRVRTVVAACGRAREDVTRAFLGYGGTSPGFAIDATVRDLPPGVHEVVLELGDARDVTLGCVEVRPSFALSAARVAIPGTWPAGRPLHLAVEGVLRSSYRALAAEVRVDGEPAGVTVALGEGKRDAEGMWGHSLSASGAAVARGAQVPHVLSVAFALEGGAEWTWEHRFDVADVELQFTLRRFDIGPFDPDTRLTRVGIEVDLFDAEPDDELALERDGVQVLVIPVAGTTRGDVGRCGLVLDRAVKDVPPGRAAFALALLRGGRRFTLRESELVVPQLRPELHVEVLTVTPATSRERPVHRLKLRGWVKNHFLVDCLIVEIDAARAAVLGMHELRPDVAQALGSPIVSRQGFDLQIDLIDVQPGEHVVHVVATQGGGDSARIGRRVLFDEHASRLVSVTSDDLEAMLRGGRKQFYGALAIRGTLSTRAGEIVVALVVDDRVLDEQAFQGAGVHELSLRAVPAASGEHEVKLVVSSRGRLVFATEPARVSFRRVEPPSRLAADLGALLDRFDLRGKLIGAGSDHALVQRLLEWQSDRTRELVETLEEAGERVRRPPAPANRPRVPAEGATDRRLRVLFASWEVPSRLHGGGVYLTNLLRRLGARHDVTLVHTYGVDEVSHLDAMRPYVHRVIGVPRVHLPARYRGGGRFPLHLYDVYTPELRRVLEMEVASGGYDLVDYEYSAMGPYVVPGVPSVLTIYETGYTALLGSAFREARPVDAVVPDLDRLLRSFHYFTSELPRLCNHLVTLTEEDAVAITEFSTARVYTSPAGADVLPVVAGAPRPERGPVLAYVGNFRHPPNGHAVLYFAREVMPRLLARHPDAELRVYGSGLPPEVQALDGRHGVRIQGFVDDLGAALAEATAVVTPIFTGTGQRIKVLDALGAGALVIGTDLSLRGLSVVDRRHCYRANDADSFLTAIEHAWAHPDEAAAIAAAGRELVKARHGWDAAAARRDAIWRAVVEDSSRHAAERRGAGSRTVAEAE